MPKSLYRVADEIYQMLAPLPIGFSLEVREPAYDILLKYHEFGCTLTREYISNHITDLGNAVKPMFASFKSTVALYHAVSAGLLDVGVLRAVAAEMPDHQVSWIMVHNLMNRFRL